MSTKHNSTCLKNAGDNEEIFVLRAQDVYADKLVDMWADMACGRLGRDHPKVVSARAIASLMRATSGRKLPD